MLMTQIFWLFIIWGIPLIVCVKILQAKKRSMGWLFFAILIGYFAIPLVAFLPAYKVCPRCKKAVRREVIVCGYCYHDFKAAADAKQSNI